MLPLACDGAVLFEKRSLAECGLLGELCSMKLEIRGGGVLRRRDSAVRIMRERSVSPRKHQERLSWTGSGRAAAASCLVLLLLHGVCLW